MGEKNSMIFDPVKPQNNINSKNSKLSSHSDTGYIFNLSLSFIFSDEDSVNNENINNYVTSENCSVAYFAGYLSNNKFKCIL